MWNTPLAVDSEHLLSLLCVDYMLIMVHHNSSSFITKIMSQMMSMIFNCCSMSCPSGNTSEAFCGEWHEA